MRLQKHFLINYFVPVAAAINPAGRGRTWQGQRQRGRAVHATGVVRNAVGGRNEKLDGSGTREARVQA
jgi:hypothetical protein